MNNYESYKTKKEKRKKVLKEFNGIIEQGKFEDENVITYTENGEAIVDCNIGELNTIFSKYDMQKYKTLEPLFFDYLMEETSVIPIEKNLQINFFVNSTSTEEQKQKAQKAFNAHFSFATFSATKELERKKIKSSILFIFGIITLFISALVFLIDTILPIYELMLIITWFFSWEGFAIAILESSSLKRKRFNYIRLYKSKINFIDIV